MKIDHRLIQQWSTELVLTHPCGCAWIMRTREQVAICPEHNVPPVQTERTTT